MKHQKTVGPSGRWKEWLTNKKVPAKLIFIISGIAATAWFLVRVIPKPSRAAYPCMKAAFPVMATFILWLTSFTGAFVAFKGVGRLFRKSRYLAGITVFVSGLVFSSILVNTGILTSIAGTTEAAPKADVIHPANQPMGEPQGVIPGRVVWNWNPDATDENCTNNSDDLYVWDSNTDQDVVNEMIDRSIRDLAQTETTADAWDIMFRHFNKQKGKGDVGYSNDEIIFIKINEGTSSWSSNNDLTRRNWNSAMSETSPQVTLAVLEQLIDVAGVPQENIWVADPKSHIWQNTYEKLHAVYPDVKYGDRDGDYGGTRDLLTLHETASLKFSDKGAVMPDAIRDYYYTQMITADYLVNLAALKAHARAGITLTAKNHFGSHYRDGAWHMHPGLVAPENDIVERPEYGQYRVLVDIMGSSVLGGNTLLFLVDGLWGGTEATEYPVKWTMEPFNNDWPNSIFVSMDQVALESVCFDFLRHEADVGSELWKNRPNFAQGVDDYLHQAADSENWPEGIIYDPDSTGTPIGSLGTHEHWNSPASKQYTKNLGGNKGIELITYPTSLVPEAKFEAWESETALTIDGTANEAVWEKCEWYRIDQLWIDWGINFIPEDDFKGRFKVAWSSETDLLYLLVETSDDVFVDGYVYPETGYPDYDILEVFIDEDKSGGGHVFDNGTDNAENAFSYHIAIDQPAEGATATTAHVLDIAGTSWGDRTTPDYFNHFPEFVAKRSGGKLIWEFSMQVHKDNFDPGDQAASISELTKNKVLGLSVAYCDNDDPNEEPLQRDNFFGSVAVDEANYNDHWQNADDYGELRLKSDLQPNNAPVASGTIDDYTFTEKGVSITHISDLGTYFSDADGDPLAYIATSSEPFILPAISGNTLQLTAQPGFRGTVTVTVSAADDEEEVSLQFQVTSPNLGPVVAEQIEDYEIEELGKTETVEYNLKYIFSDDEGDALLFEATSSDPELTVEIIGDDLRVKSTLDFVGPATITVTASDGELSSELQFDVTTTVGVSFHEINESLKLYPIPVGDILHVEFNSASNADVFIRIIDGNGRIHHSAYLQKVSQLFRQPLDANKLPSGIYVLEVHQEGAKVNMRFVK